MSIEQQLKSLALQKAVDLVTSRVMFPESNIQLFTAEEIIEISDKIYNWLIKTN